MENFMHTWMDILTLFHINAATLWRWCRRAHIVPHRDPADNRRRFLDDAQLVLLARQHHRVVAVNNVNEIMLGQIGELSRKVAELEKSMKKELNQ
jgi:DNA-binding transcriptional MerR regulator